MGVLRWEFRTALVQIEDTVLRLGRRVEAVLPQALQALHRGAPADIDAVLALDDLAHREALAVGDEIYRLLATQAPVAGDLRLLIGLMHVLRSVERAGDHCVDIARLSQVDGAPPVETDRGADAMLLQQVDELGLRAQRTLATGLDVFGRRMVDGLARTEALEQPLDTLRTGLIRRLMTHAATSGDAAAWSMRMMLTTRHLERVGDHAMCIAEQGVFVATGSHRPARAAR